MSNLQSIAEDMVSVTGVIKEKPLVKGIWVEKSVESKLRVSISSNKHIWMYGPQGVGKSTIAQNILENMGRPFYRIQGHAGFDSSEWYGGPDIDNNGNISVIYSEMVKAMEEGYPCIVEEFNFILPHNKGPVFSMLDDTPFVDIAINGRTRRVHKHPDFFVIVTANDNGSGDSLHIYGGGERENTALLSRFNIIKVGYLDRGDEIKMVTEKTGFKNRTTLKAMYKVVAETRKIAESDTSSTELAISPRTFISWAQAYQSLKEKVSKGHARMVTHEDIYSMVVVDRLPDSLQDTARTMCRNSLGSGVV